MDKNKLRPEWTPENAGEEFASVLSAGVDESRIIKPNGDFVKRKSLTARDYVDGILSGDRMILSKAITIIESNAPKHFPLGQEIIQNLLPHTGNSVRLGITGVPGAGKSTFIEALGTFLCDAGKKVAVLAVDPSSTVTKGSILGDKTRMEKLSRRPEAFIRPSPSGGTLGGVTRKSKETILLCEAAGFDTILVETVGVGQSETMVRSMVDFFLVLVITGAGDDLQGIKKGIIEIADAILVNKADGDNKMKALSAKSEYNQILHYLMPATQGWITKAYACSALTGEGIGEIWAVAEDFVSKMKESGLFFERRKHQNLAWVKQLTDEHIRNRVYSNSEFKKALETSEKALLEGKISPTLAVSELIEVIEKEFFGGRPLG